MAKKTKRKFSMHSNLLYDVINRQAGTLSKSVLEAVMNSVDAQATECIIAIDQDTLVVSDDGKGFPSQKSIEQYFEVFGTPHTADEEKTYGNFRMGRGQLFAFGENVWSSGKFQMDVDFKNRGLDYDLTINTTEPTPGCEVAVFLYKKLLPSELQEIIREVQHYCKWIPIPVFLNDEQISTDPAEAEWDYESDTCYVKLNTRGTLDIYNLGAYVTGESSTKWGRGGIVVSKKQLRLNFARNQVLVSECEIWKEVAKFVRDNSDREISRKPRLNEAERCRLVNKLMHEYHPDCGDYKIITDIGGRHWSPKELRQTLKNYPGYSGSTSRDKTRADKIHQMKLAFVMRQDTLDRFNVESPEEVFAILDDRLPRNVWKPGRKYLPLAQLFASLNASYIILDEKDLRPNEKVWLRLLNSAGGGLRIRDRGEADSEKRVFKIGISDIADGWTDGMTYIAVSREFVSRHPPSSMWNVIQMGHLVLHEWCHDAPDTETHEHTTEFYQTFHDSVDLIAWFVAYVVYRLPKALEAVGKKLTSSNLRMADQQQRIETAAAKLQEAANTVAGKSK